VCAFRLADAVDLLDDRPSNGSVRRLDLGNDQAWNPKVNPSIGSARLHFDTKEAEPS
jgi:hypothetical protein|tara:strand:- start:163 stop:333 length:171 start_codon:yes stop_codon:yes gene_type:complete